MAVVDIGAADVHRLYKTIKAATPGKAAAIVRIGLAVWRFGILEGLPGMPAVIELNPFAKQKLKSTAKKR